MKILEVEDLRVGFPVTGGVFARKIAEVKAVDGVSFALEQGETLGVVGESGCGKSTVGRAIVNILRAMVYGVEISGKIIYHPAATGRRDSESGVTAQLATQLADTQLLASSNVRAADGIAHGIGGFGAAQPQGDAPLPP